ncbi:MAG: rcc01693 family protein [Pseudomonadota bacterium]
MSAVDWPGLMRAGVRGAGLRPVEFWALTPAELELMLGKPAGLSPLTRAGLDDLMRAYPDQVADEKDDA